ncbi:hypothetical protein EON66_10740 [archaeon]|nr:MAG: hypothetical protein EON66_10740 [archaeon]
MRTRATLSLNTDAKSASVVVNWPAAPATPNISTLRTPTVALPPIPVPFACNPFQHVFTVQGTRPARCMPSACALFRFRIILLLLLLRAGSSHQRGADVPV